MLRFASYLTFSLAVCASPGSAVAQQIDLGRMQIIDLSHTYGTDTLYWPTDKSGFELEQVAHGHTDGGYFYAANRFCTAEHGGTHMDAPIHFAEGGGTLESIPLESLIAPAIVIDVTKAAASDSDYRLSLDDVLAFERKHGVIEAGAIVLLRTGWSSRWPDRLAYLGDDTPGDASKLSFPSFGEAAARLLIEQRDVAMIGVDTASIDYGPSRDFIVHRIAGARDVPGLENLTNLDRLPPRGAIAIALPVKIKDGSGGPTRVIALLPSK